MRRFDRRRIQRAHAHGNTEVENKWPQFPGKYRILPLNSHSGIQRTPQALVQRLKANGYDGYVVQAEVKEKIYYRVRVGHFETREKAESVRQSLARQAGYRDAYLTGD